ncbi:uncharacterized protein Tco025E_03654 [Trypanosoma conorhini]|uniref:Uncharacterized protein n=1 Tax=Trypanosoma conorhini TaxID=83891 RepID=A0A3R7PJ39_9TRYP|nr:uncharacterized protein Tco025E_03654 [Trypanosoma conorhini]RNF20746.1 hypothetical protein Tco025E_03654 [Trypanosoma conorhini]
MGLRNADVHARILRALSDRGLRVVVQEAVVSSVGARLSLTPCFTSLPFKLNEAVHALLFLTQSMIRSDAEFEVAFQRSEAASKRLAAEFPGDAEEFLRSEDVTAALSYITDLKRFRALWALLFVVNYPRSSPQFVPPHIFAVRWSEVLREDTPLGWLRAVQEQAKRTLAAIQAGNTSPFTYLLFVLQHALSMRTVLLECVAEMMLNSAVRFDVMAVVRNMHKASEALREMGELQGIWEQEGLLSDALRESCLSYQFSDLNLSHSFWDHCGLGQIPSHTERHAKSFLLCPFSWILQHLVWCLYGRLTLLFQSCFVATPLGSLSRHAQKEAGAAGVASHGGLQPVVGRRLSHADSSFGRRQEERADLTGNSAATEVVSVLRRRAVTSASSVSVDPAAAGPQSRSRVVSLARGESAARFAEDAPPQASHSEFPLPFDLNYAGAEGSESGFLDTLGSHTLAEALWEITHERPRATLFLITDCTQRPGARAWQRNRCTVTTCADDVAGRQGMEHWVLNFVCPSSRLSENAMKRAQQESMLLRTVVFQVAGSTQRRARFTNDVSVFYVVRSDSDMDGGRLYFVLLLQHDASTSHLHGGMADTGAKEVTAEESRWAFRSLEEVCAAWSMPQLCNLAVRLAVALS